MNPYWSYRQIIPGEAPVRMDGGCLLRPRALVQPLYSRPNRDVSLTTCQPTGLSMHPTFEEVFSNRQLAATCGVHF